MIYIEYGGQQYQPLSTQPTMQLRDKINKQLEQGNAHWLDVKKTASDGSEHFGVILISPGVPIAIFEA